MRASTPWAMFKLCLPTTEQKSCVMERQRLANPNPLAKEVNGIKLVHREKQRVLFSGLVTNLKDRLTSYLAEIQERKPFINFSAYY